MNSSDEQDSRPQWQVLAEKKRTEIQNLLPEEWKVPPVPSPSGLRDATRFPREYLSPREVAITEALSVPALLGKLSNGELSAVEVVKAFCHRATIAHQLVSEAIKHPYTAFEGFETMSEINACWTYRPTA